MLQVTPPTSPHARASRHKAEKIFNTPNPALHLQRVTDPATAFPFLGRMMHSPGEDRHDAHSAARSASPSWLIFSSGDRFGENRHRAQGVSTGVRKRGAPAFSVLGTWVQTRISRKARCHDGRGISQHLHQFLVFIYFFSTMLKNFSTYLEKQHTPTYPLWDDRYEPLGPDDHEFLLSSWPEKTKDLM